MLVFLPCKLCIFIAHGVAFYHFANLVNVWKTSGDQKSKINQQFLFLDNFNRDIIGVILLMA